jgi:hypothetical protein
MANEQDPAETESPCDARVSISFIGLIGFGPSELARSG